jgi:hypothetical protein
MTMTDIKIEYLPEPKLQFGSYFEHEDSKTGLAEFGPFGKNISGLHPSEIPLGFIGTRETIAGAKEWIEECGSPIESENRKVIEPEVKNDIGPSLFGAGIFEDEGSLPKPDDTFVRIYKILNRDFIGFNRDSQFGSIFQTNDRWDRVLQPIEINRILEIEDKQQRIWELVNLFDDQIRVLAETKPSPRIIILALTTQMVEEAHAVQVTGNFFLNFRRAIKARAMKWGIPIQLLQRSTILGKKSKWQKGRVQEKATRAWNFCTALYYKANGVPWRPTIFDQDTCFVGVGFYVARELKDRLTMRSSVAQAFDFMGQGLVLRGDPFEWDDDKKGPSPHMTQEGARRVIEKTLKEYVRVKGTTPKRVVIHKSSRFWGREHEEYNELDGFLAGVQEVFPGIETDMVTLSQGGVKLFREGSYPSLRGTYFQIGDQHFLYTMGFVPYLATYPGTYVPDPWQIVEKHGGSGEKELLREVLQLTKMNVNNCSFADGTPITLSFSQKVGEIMKHVPEDRDADLKSGYAFYM